MPCLGWPREAEADTVEERHLTQSPFTSWTTALLSKPKGFFHMCKEKCQTKQQLSQAELWVWINRLWPSSPCWGAEPRPLSLLSGLLHLCFWWLLASPSAWKSGQKWLTEWRISQLTLCKSSALSGRPWDLCCLQLLQGRIELHEGSSDAAEVIGRYFVAPFSPCTCPGSPMSWSWLTLVQFGHFEHQPIPTGQLKERVAVIPAACGAAPGLKGSMSSATPDCCTSKAHPQLSMKRFQHRMLTGLVPLPTCWFSRVAGMVTAEGPRWGTTRVYFLTSLLLREASLQGDSFGIRQLDSAAAALFVPAASNVSSLHLGEEGREVGIFYQW